VSSRHEETGEQPSLGARQLLTFLRSKSRKKGFCWWKQETIATAMERGLRTVNRQVAELVKAGCLKSEPHGHCNQYILSDLAGKVAYRAVAEENLVDSDAVGVAATPNWRTGPAPVSMIESLEPERDTPALQRHSVPAPENDVALVAVERVKAALQKRACVQCGFGSHDRAEIWRMLGSAPVETIERAILLGCQRKLKALINGEGRGSRIVSVRYFAAVVEEVQSYDPGPGYWLQVESWLKRYEPQWCNSQAPPSRRPQNGAGGSLAAARVAGG
jgi:Helix-turn-helix domain